MLIFDKPTQNFLWMPPNFNLYINRNPTLSIQHYWINWYNDKDSFIKDVDSSSAGKLSWQIEAI